jgi:hypothetical protein
MKDTKTLKETTMNEYAVTFCSCQEYVSREEAKGTQ